MLSVGKLSRSAPLLRLSRNFAAKAAASAAAEKPFDKILIANRGEIACRVIRTAKKLGVKTVAVYSDADANSLHVRYADEKVHIGPAQSKDSYLRMEKIIEACKKTGAQAVHPGYGFLSENSKFVELCEKEGIVFIGPTSGPMLAMGDKINSKKIAKDAGCFVIPGFQGEVRDGDHAVELVKEIGYPVMVKASAGGGGKGMRVCYNENELREGFKLSKSESMASFGDDRMLIERFIEDPHHIEIQVLADSHGNVVAFPERECSVQRRNQKVVEEAPSCLLTPQTRKLMQEQAIMLCKATGYRSAGTVEMLADGKQNFYFLEMNTRLQVEHPITELISGEDLVEHMLWVAAGKKLPERLTKQNGGCLGFNGWAIESRVYAEDPLRNFLPSIGPLITYKEPETFVDAKLGTVRCDSGVYEGGVISMYYDPMISKLCTHGKTRAEAISLMENALDQYVVQGLGNNLCFLRSVMRNKVFRDGNYGTGFIAEQYPKGFKGVELTSSETLEMIATTAVMHAQIQHIKASADEFDPSFDNRCVAVLNNTAYDVELDRGDEDVKVHITPRNKDGSKMKTETIDLNSFEWPTESNICEVSWNKGVHRVVQYEGRTAEGYALRFNGSQNEIMIRTHKEHELSKHMIKAVPKDVSKFLMCPMPGSLISVSVKEGQRVEAGQQLAVVEAMKMQNILRAEKGGVIKSIRVQAGAHLKVDQVILEFEMPVQEAK